MDSRKSSTEYAFTKQEAESTAEVMNEEYRGQVRYYIEKEPERKTK